jgi:hypothetical protein
LWTVPGIWARYRILLLRGWESTRK